MCVTDCVSELVNVSESEGVGDSVRENVGRMCGREKI